MDDRSKTNEPRRVEGLSVESDYSIDYPLIGNQSQISGSARAIVLFAESIRCLHDGDEMKGRTLYQEALQADPFLHTHACDALSNIAQSCSPEDAGAIYYWLGIHFQYLNDFDQAVIWYEKAIQAFHKIGYPKREGRAHCNLGTVKMRLKDPSGMDEYEKAIALNPYDGIAYIDIGTAYYMIDDHERALDAFAEAVFADPARYGPVVISRLQRWEYTWQEELDEIGKRIAKKQGVDLDSITAGEREEIIQAHQYYEIGNAYFQSRRYKEALEQFEIGKLVSKKFPGNFFGVSMTSMQMIELKAITADQIPFYLRRAEQNIDECLRIAPTHLDYQYAKKLIGEYKNKYHVS